MRYAAALLTLLLVPAHALAAQPADSSVSALFSFEELKRAAEAGDAQAQWQLGVAFDQGMGSPADPAEAVRWFEKAMEGGNAKAFASMAVMHASGRGVPVNYALARELYRKAAVMGEPHGYFGIGVLHIRGEGVSRDLDEAFAWMLVAAAQGDPQAVDALDSGLFAKSDSSVATARAQAISREFGLEEADDRKGD